MLLYTIGHSNHPVDELIALVEGKGITQVVDIRSRPYSHYSPQFNKKALQQSLLYHGIEYVYMGEALGGRPNDASCYIHGVIPAKSSDAYQEVDYQVVMQRTWFTDGIRALLDIASRQPTCILCSEKDPAHCHRHYLIARYLLESHPEVTTWHILANGSLLDAASTTSQGGQQDTGQLTLDL